MQNKVKKVIYKIYKRISRISFFKISSNLFLKSQGSILSLIFFYTINFIYILYYIYIYIYTQSCVCMCLFTQALRTCSMWHKINFRAEFDCFELKNFLLQDWLPYHGRRAQSAQLDGGRIIEFVPFPRVSALIWNTNSRVQDLNFGRHVHFLHVR